MRMCCEFCRRISHNPGGEIREKFGDIRCRKLADLRSNLAGFVLFLSEDLAEWAVYNE